MGNSKAWMRGALATIAIGASGAAQAATMSVITTPPSPYYVTLSNSWGGQSSYTHNILTSGQESSVSSFLASNPVGQSGSLNLYFSDDEGDSYSSFGSQNLEYFQYNLNGAGWVGTVTSAYEVDGTICFSGNLNNPACRAGYFGFSISLSGAQLASLLGAPGVPQVGIRVNPNYQYQQDFYFKGSILTANGSARNVPEPATLGLVGLGLVGLGFARRKMQA